MVDEWCVSGLTKYLINRLKFNKNVNKLLTQEHIFEALSRRFNNPDGNTL